jgi:hypothetical protein
MGHARIDTGKDSAMKRHLCAAALFALVALPDWASACWARWYGPVRSYSYAAPVYCEPPAIYYAPYCLPPAFVYPCPPAVIVPHAPPPAAPPTRAPKVEAKPQARSDEPLSKPISEPVRPAANTEPLPPPKPKPLDPPAKLDFPGIGFPELPVLKKPEPKQPPKLEIEEPKLPPLVLPTKPDPVIEEPKLPPLGAPAKPDDGAPKLPPIELPKLDAPKLPPIELPGAPAIPQPAPAPDGLPPLSLPPDAPVEPLKVEAKASPLARDLKVSVFAAAGANAAGNGLRKVGFYNHTKRDLQLTVEGKQVKLPAMTYLHAQLPAVFVWQCDDRPAERATVPDTASGIDVLFRESAH